MWPKMSQHFAPWVHRVKWSWLQGNFHSACVCCCVVYHVCLCVCVYDPISQGHEAVWKGGVVQPLIGYVKILAAVKVEGELYSNYHVHLRQFLFAWQHSILVCSHWQQTVFQSGMWHWRPIKCLICWRENKATNEENKCHCIKTDKHKA